MKRSSGYSNKGFTYLECLVAFAIIGFCTLILSASFRSKEAFRKNAEYHTRAISALTSEADLIRVRATTLSLGKHSFFQAEKLLQGLPKAEASYTVAQVPSIPGLLRVQLMVSWSDRRAHRNRNLEIYVHQ